MKKYQLKGGEQMEILGDEMECELCHELTSEPLMLDEKLVCLDCFDSTYEIERG